MNLRVWNVINPPAPALFYLVNSVDDAKKKIDELTQVQLDDVSVFSNAFGLEEQNEDGSWSEWYDEFGNSLLDVMDQDEYH